MNTLLLPALDLLVKSTGILLLAFALQSLWRQSSAAQRCLLWGCTFTLLALLPVTLLVKPLWSVGPMSAPLPASSLPWETTVEIVPASKPLPPASDASAEASASTSWGITEMLFSAWLGGALVILLRRGLGVWQVKRMERQGTPLEDGRTRSMVHKLARDFGVFQPLTLLQSSRVPVPLTWGIFRPVLQLPNRALSWSDASLEAALRHELGHIRHRDAATRLFASLVGAFFWPNLLVWLAARAWRTAQEQACDDLVLRSGAPTETYAMQLLDAARSMNAISLSGSPVMAMARPSTLETRLSAIMDENRSRQPLQRSTWLISAALAVPLLLSCAVLQIRAQVNTPDSGSMAQTQMKRAQELIIPSIAFRDTSMKDAVAFLRRECEAQDPTVNSLRVVLAIPDDQLKDVRITLQLKNCPLHDALKYLTQLAGVRFRYDNTAIIVLPAEGKPEAILTNFYSGVAGIGGPSKDAQAWLETQGITFPPGTSAVASGKSYMIIRHYAAEIDKVNLIVEKYRKATGQTAALPAPPVDPNTPPLKKKAAAIIIPRVDFANTPLEEAVKFLQAESIARDPNKKGVNLSLKNPGTTPARIYLVLREVPLADAIGYVASLAKLKVSYGENAVIMEP